ncbi:MarR family winged helix-turn-helix transcriptional regulator [Kineosporia babensis]|uniref:Uncharacterized protein n=1 Tax=Kineosporia babensis TaxID=499548 RepID=A0A9X1NII4_9ACTN|nr:hypothetical protein [Kineosporia babensis]MCD5313866.1 hypothetical protein [Kineosporia babensis]
MSTVLNGADIGRAHYAVRALLERRLEPTGLSFEHWIPLNAIGTKGEPVPEGELIAFVTEGLRLSPQQTRRRVADLLAEKLLVSREDGRLALSERGQELWSQVTAEVKPITSYLFEGFTEAERATVVALLAKVTERADAALAAP